MWSYIVRAPREKLAAREVIFTMESLFGALLLLLIGAGLGYLFIFFVLLPAYRLYKKNERLK